MSVAEGSARIVELVEFDQPLDAATSPQPLLSRNAALLAELSVTLDIHLGSAHLTGKQLFELVAGSVIELDRSVEDPVDVMLNGKVVARGRLVACDDQLGVLITDISPDSP